MKEITGKWKKTFWRSGRESFPLIFLDQHHRRDDVVFVDFGDELFNDGFTNRGSYRRSCGKLDVVFHDEICNTKLPFSGVERDTAVVHAWDQHSKDDAMLSGFQFTVKRTVLEVASAVDAGTLMMRTQKKYFKLKSESFRKRLKLYFKRKIVPW